MCAAPVRLSTAYYVDDNEYPKFSVFKTARSKSIVELFIYDKIQDGKNMSPMFCRAVYKTDKIPVTPVWS